MESQPLAPSADSSNTGHADIQALTERIVLASSFVEPLRHEVGKVVVGQKGMVDTLLIGLLADGHVLLEGVPGLAKTLAIQTLSQAVAVDFSRIQFTPDLLPADVVGTMIYNQKEEAFSVSRGPIFAHFVLADEINRAPAKVQSALLEAMQERQVTIGSETFPLPNPFLVLATQNPVEQEGTYPLPEAQVDRFLLKAVIDYPSPEEEQNILRAQVAAGPKPKLLPVVKPDALLNARELVREVYMDEKVERYIVQLVHATRRPENQGMGHLAPLIGFGASPRATIGLALAGKARAFMSQRGYVIPEDIRAVAMDVLRHRIGLTFEAEAEEIRQEQIVTEILDQVQVP
ncbi:MAG: ATPase [Crocinitomicaceae bacterium]|nr:ATPase [Crocinitomicaceae bacterium]